MKHSGKPWWKEPMMWLVLGLPGLVVIASLVTAVIAIAGADEVMVVPHHKHGLTVTKPAP